MKNEAKSSAWDSMSVIEKDEWLAKFIGWEVVPQPEEKGWSSYAVVKEPSGYVHTDWSPTTDWNHWRTVEMKIMEDTGNWKMFCKQLCFVMDFMGENGNLTAMELLMKADLPTRAKALFLAFKSLR